MLKWQRRVRLGLAIFGLICAIVVYAAIGERRASVVEAPPVRTDPRAILESTGAALQQFSAEREDYVIEAERQLTYEGGETKFVGVTIKVGQRAGRDFVVSGREAQAGDGQKDMEITGGVQLSASDGFVATTERATFAEADATVRADGPVSFRKGRMSGSGVGMSYDQSTDVLTLARDVRVAVIDDEGGTTAEFASASATLARIENYLALEGDVHALRDGQVLQANAARALLSEGDDVVRFIELRGAARVSGGDAFEQLSADDIDLDYSDEGATLEGVLLRGDGRIAMIGANGGAGRQFAGALLELSFAADGSVTRATGHSDVRMTLPAVGSTPARTIEAQVFDASGEAGSGLTAARFDERVEYREDDPEGRSPRVARSGTLTTSLSADGVSAAMFSGGVAFEAEGLRATAGQVEYDPAAGGLRLRGAEAGRAPRVADTSIEIDADSIDVILDGPRILAAGNVSTLLHPGTAPGRDRLPGLLRQGTTANVRAGSLDYSGVTGTASYRDRTMLWQGDTTIQADALSLDQRRADLVATGRARANLPLDGGASVGRADEIRYDDATRRILLGGPGQQEGGTSSEGAEAHLSGPHGDLQARRIELALAAADSRVDRLEAFQRVTARVGGRVATGDRLTYFDADGRYVITGVATMPVAIVEACRETTGRTVTFFRTGDRVIVDGNEEIRTQSKRNGSCPEAPAP